MKTIYSYACQVYKNFKAHNMAVYAASASYFIILAAFPCFTLLLNLIQLIPNLEKDLIQAIFDYLPSAIAPFITQIVEDLYEKSSGTIISISAVTALWSASKGVLAIDRGLDQVFNTPETRGYLISRIISAVYTFLFILLFIASLGLLVFGNQIQMTLAQHYPAISQITGVLIGMRTLLSICILTMFFAFLFKFLPRRKTSIKHQLPGALFSTFGWLLFSFFFSLYIDNFSNFSYMYGSLTAMVLLMLWLYSCIYILFIGAEINVLLNQNSTEKGHS